MNSSAVTAPLVIKVGGALLKEQQATYVFFAVLKKLKRPWLLVHGGGYWLEQRFAQLGVKSQKIDGRRVTPWTLQWEVVEVLAGRVNKQLCAIASATELSVVGFTMTDGCCLQVQPLAPELGAVGTASVRTKNSAEKGAWWLQLLATGWHPIVSSVGLSSEGYWLNVNADEAAAAMAQALDADLMLLSDVPGVLDEKGTCLTSLDRQGIEQYRTAGIIQDGMLIKVESALQAAQQLQRPVLIGSWRQLRTWIEKDCSFHTRSDFSWGTHIVPKYTQTGSPQ